MLDTDHTTTLLRDALSHRKAKTGKIALQDHGSVFWFRNVKIRPLQ